MPQPHITAQPTESCKHTVKFLNISVCTNVTKCQRPILKLLGLQYKYKRRSVNNKIPTHVSLLLDIINNNG